MWRLVDMVLGVNGYRGQEFCALKPLNLTVPKGESLALVGCNGSGKSTLLKLIAGVAAPSAGRLRTQGRVAALLELGTGFHPEFTGRQNLLTNARLMGLSDDETEERMGDIIAFSELGEFIDRKVRTYSSGMLLRLGFSLATHVSADILAVDEALAVGDAYFQSKCMKRIQRWVHEEGRTLLYVSHDPGTVKLVCNRAVLLSHGTVVGDGAPDTVLDHYNALLAGNGALDEAALAKAYRGEGGVVSGEQDFSVLSIRLCDGAGADRAMFVSGEEFVVECRFQNNGQVAIDDLTMGFHIRDARGYEVFGTNTWLTGHSVGRCEPGKEVVLRFRGPLGIGRGRFSLGVAFHTGREHTAKNYKWIDKAAAFDVTDDHRYIFDGVARVNGVFERVS
jgi:lipopolysaccharide transport system ATP-binding protein